MEKTSERKWGIEYLHIRAVPVNDTGCSEQQQARYLDEWRKSIPGIVSPIFTELLALPMYPTLERKLQRGCGRDRDEVLGSAKETRKGRMQLGERWTST